MPTVTYRTCEQCKTQLSENGDPGRPLGAYIEFASQVTYRFEGSVVKPRLNEEPQNYDGYFCDGNCLSQFLKGRLQESLPKRVPGSA